MVEVVHETAKQSNDMLGLGFFGWIWHYIGYIIAILIIIILGVVIYYIIKKWDEERQERDDVRYAAYKNAIRDCELQKDTNRIRRYYSLANLFFLGIPFIRKEHSAKIVNYTNDLIGYYRGHYYSMDGYLNLLMYKDKSFIFFEDKFLLKCPLHLDFKIYLRDSDNKIIKDEDGKPKFTTKRVMYNQFIHFLPNDDIKLDCSHVQKYSYIRFPVYVQTNGEIVDLREAIHEDIIKTGQDEMIGRVLSDGARMTEKAMLHNPHVLYNQKSPEKTKLDKQDENK